MPFNAGSISLANAGCWVRKVRQAVEVVARKVPRLTMDDVDCVDFWIGLGVEEYALEIPARASARRAMMAPIGRLLESGVMVAIGCDEGLCCCGCCFVMRNSTSSVAVAFCFVVD